MPPNSIMWAFEALIPVEKHYIYNTIILWYRILYTSILVNIQINKWGSIEKLTIKRSYVIFEKRCLLLNCMILCNASKMSFDVYHALVFKRTTETAW